MLKRSLWLLIICGGDILSCIQEKNNSNKSGLFMIVFSILLLLASLNLTSLYSAIGKIAIACILYGSAIFSLVLALKNKSIKVNISFLTVLIFIIIETYLLGVVNYNFQIKGLKVFFQVTLLLLFFFTMYQIDWKGKYLQYLSAMFLLFMWICLMQWVVDGMSIGLYKGYATNKNGFGSMIYLSLFFLLIRLINRSSRRAKRINYMIGSLAALLLIRVSGAKAAWLSVLVTFIVFFLWRLLIGSKIRYKASFIIFIIVLIFAFTIYIQLPTTSLGDDLNKMVLDTTGQNLFSGRQLLWPILIDAITIRPWFGYGAGATPEDISWIALSSHNWYLQTTLQVGFIGLIAFIALFYSIWTMLWMGRKDPVVKLAASFFIGILVHQMFEVSLTQNNMSLALLQWLIISIGCSRSILFANKT